MVGVEAGAPRRLTALPSYGLAGLLRRRAELAAEAAALKARLAALHADVRAVDAVIRQLRPGFDPASACGPKRLRGPDAAARGEMSRFVLGALRDAPGPLAAADLARRWEAARGLPPGAAQRRVAMALRHQELRGTVAAAREPGKAVLWAVAR